MPRVSESLPNLSWIASLPKVSLAQLVNVSIHTFEWWLIVRKDVMRHTGEERRRSLRKVDPFLVLFIESSRVLLLYSTDSPPTTALNNLISIQLDSITLNEIIANSEAQAKVVKKINFRNVNGFAKLVQGESSKFSFVKEDEKMVCDASCEVECKSIPTPSTLSSLRPFSMAQDKPLTAQNSRLSEVKNDTTTAPPYLPPVSETVTAKALTESTTVKALSSTQTRTTTLKRISTQTTTSKKPATTTMTSTTTVKPLTTSTTTQTTNKAQTSSQAPQTTKTLTTQTIAYTSSSTQPPTPSDIETATNKSAIVRPRPYIAKKDDWRGPPYLPPHNAKKDEAVTPPTTTRRNFFSSSTQKQTRQQQSTTQRRITNQRLSTQSPVAQRLTFPASTRRSTPGPAYLPIAKKSTARRSTVTERSYPPATWPSTTRHYTQTFPTWSAPVRRSTEARIVTSTAKYSYRAPANSLIYASDAE